MAENLLTYTKVDNAPPNDRLDVTADKCVVAGMIGGDGVLLRDDKVGGRFGPDAEHTLTITPRATSNGGVGYFWAVSNASGELDDYDGEQTLSLALVGLSSPQDRAIHFRNHETGWFTSLYTPSLNTPYYIAVKRYDETTIQCFLYSDAGHNNLLDWWSTAISSGRRFRYQFAVSSEADAAQAISFDVEDFVLDDSTTYDVSAGVGSDGIVADADAESWRVVDAVGSDGIVAGGGVESQATLGAGASAEVSAAAGPGSLGELLGLAADGIVADRSAVALAEIIALASDGIVADRSAVGNRVYDGVASDGIVADRDAGALATLMAAAQSDATATVSVAALAELLTAALAALEAAVAAAAAKTMPALASDGIVADRSAATIKIMPGAGSAGLDAGIDAAALATWMADALAPAALAAATSTLQTMVASGRGAAKVSVSADTIGELLAAAQADANAADAAGAITIYPCIAGIEGGGGSGGWRILLTADMISGPLTGQPVPLPTLPAGLVTQCRALGGSVKDNLCISTTEGGDGLPCGIEYEDETSAVAHVHMDVVLGAQWMYARAEATAENKAGVPHSDAVLFLTLGEPGGPGVDWTALGNDASAGGGAAFGTTGQIGDAVDLPIAGSSYLNVGDTPDVDFGAGDWSISFWAKFHDMSPAVHYVIAGKDQAGARQFMVFWANDNQMRIEYRDASENRVELKSGIGFWPDTTNFHHVVAQRNGNSFDIYRDGGNKVSGTTSGVHGAMAATGAPLNFGRRSYSGYEYHADMTLDHVEMRSAAWTDDEVAFAAAGTAFGEWEELAGGGSMAIGAGGSAAAKHLSGAIARSYIDAGVSTSTLAELLAAAQSNAAAAGSPSAVAEMLATAGAEAAAGGIAAAVKAFMAAAESDAVVAITAASLVNLLAAASGAANASIGAAALETMQAAALVAGKADADASATPTFPTEATVALDADAAAAALRVLVAAAAAESLANAQTAGLLTAGAEAAVETTVTISAASAGELTGLAIAGAWAAGAAQTLTSLRVTATSPAQVAASVAANATVQALVRSGLALSIIATSDVTDESCEIIILAVGGKVITIT